ncbi:hypothetical protein NQX30_00370 [Candidatus Persebacteraceae bacterium Df01]|uniref:Transmembrane protein n=1 Tax=Candidatus Doriopsillibacter californiensis TaxID=2970740 RepID=A0ABT7QJE0_9GAMM|nr:hypothetical protein [Candidatus Persebacteraceae bacterium Df01]
MKKRWPLVLIILISVLTPVASTLLFYFSPPTAHTENGDLLSPTSLPAWGSSVEKGKWALLQAAPGECGDDCQRRLCRMRQLRLMLPGHYLRLQRAWLMPDADEPTSQMTTSDCGETLAAAFSERAAEVSVSDNVLILRGNITDLPVAAPGLQRSDYLYLVDPAGLLFMRFAPTLDIYEIRKDMAKLLKISKGRRRISR